jgi:hypothetical protein
LLLAPDGQERFVFHAAQNLDLAAAKRWVRDSERRIARQAVAAVDAVFAELEQSGARVAGAAVVGETLEDPGSVEAILASHSGMHTAEGVLYRRVIVDALQARGVECELVSKRVLPDPEVLAPLGKVASPWRAEHKDAARAALSLVRGGARGRAR